MRAVLYRESPLHWSDQIECGWREGRGRGGGREGGEEDEGGGGERRRKGEEKHKGQR